MQINPQGKMLPHDEHKHLFTDNELFQFEVKLDPKLIADPHHLLYVCRRYLTRFN